MIKIKLEWSNYSDDQDNSNDNDIEIPDSSFDLKRSIKTCHRDQYLQDDQDMVAKF